MVDTITQKQLANQVGVSVSTISLALRNDVRISQDLRVKIQNLATELGYTYHLRKVSPANVTQVVFVGRYDVANAFYSVVLSGAERVFQQHEISLHYSQIDDAASEIAVHNEDVDAFLIAGSINEQIIQQFMRLKRPIVLIDNNLPHLGLDRVLIQNEMAIYQTVKRLKDWGHQRIAYMSGPQNHPSFHERLAGYRRAVTELDLPFQEIPCDETQFSYQRKLMHHWVEEHGKIDFSALVVCNDDAAVGAMRGLQDQGIRVPEEVSVVGFDDVEVCMITNPALTTHHVFRKILGEMGARMLIERIANPGRPAMSLTVDTTFIERDSTRRL
jgi:DNA-binding LacI/PurR family transcriptional regulator